VRHARDRLPVERDARRARAGHGVVVDDHHAVARGVHVELDGVRALLERQGEGGERVLRALARRAPVRDDLGPRRHPWGGRS
jgi:hypothetical protein